MTEKIIEDIIFGLRPIEITEQQYRVVEKAYMLSLPLSKGESYIRY